MNIIIQYKNAKSRQDIAKIKELFLEYAQSLSFNLCFQNFEHELESLPGDYSEPDGCLILVNYNDTPAASIALHRFDSTSAEMKRLYVRPQYRGMSIARRLCNEVIDFARKRGYQSIKLDTIDTMIEAIALYESLGFREIDPYRFNPCSGARYFELELNR